MSEILVEKIARAMAVALGRDPDEIHTIGLGDHRCSIPYWRMQQEWAIRYLAAKEVMDFEPVAFGATSQPFGTIELMQKQLRERGDS